MGAFDPLDLVEGVRVLTPSRCPRGSASTPSLDLRGYRTPSSRLKEFGTPRASLRGKMNGIVVCEAQKTHVSHKTSKIDISDGNQLIS